MLSQEIAQLQSRYDAMSDVKERAAERYKTDYQKWRKFKDWIFMDEGETAKRKDGQEVSAEEKKRRRTKNVMKKKKLVMELGTDYAVKGEEDSRKFSSLIQYGGCQIDVQTSIVNTMSSIYGWNFASTRRWQS